MSTLLSDGGRNLQERRKRHDWFDTQRLTFCTSRAPLTQEKAKATAKKEAKKEPIKKEKKEKR